MKVNYPRPARNRSVIRELPLHKRKRLMNVHLSRELRNELKTRSLPVRKGDTVVVKNGKNAGWQKKVIKVNLKQMKVQIEGIKRVKTDSTEIFQYIHPSNLVITALANRDDRKKILERNAEANTKKTE